MAVDQPTQAIAEYAAGVHADSLDSATVHAATRHLIETFPAAPHADLCPEVAGQLQSRLEKL